jgi:fatty-acyl-CoA synthase
VRLKPGHVTGADKLFAFCRSHPAPYKTPRTWVFLDDLSLTPSGKVQKFVLRESWIAQRGAGAMTGSQPAG